MSGNLTEQTLELFHDTDFNNIYFDVFINRFSHSNISLEKDLGNPDSNKNAVRLKNNMDALRMLLNLDTTIVDEDTIIDVAKIVNKDAMYISDDYRQIGSYIADSEIPISDPDNIRSDVFRLLKNYHSDWQGQDVFEREARFHLEFIRIHPFEDGNGRTSRLLMNFNLLNQQCAPVVITDDDCSLYYDFIASNDALGLGQFLKDSSVQELGVINAIYNDMAMGVEKSDRHNVL